MIRIKNHAIQPFSGWVRTVVDTKPDFGATVINTPGPIAAVVPGRQIGLDTFAIDVLLTELEPQRVVTIDMADIGGDQIDVAHVAADPDDQFGPIKLNGQPMRWISWESDGAALRGHVRARAGIMLVVDVWFRWYPGQPWVEGEYLVTASNPATSAMGENCPALVLEIPKAHLSITGRHDSSIVNLGLRLADGQGKAAPFAALMPGIIVDHSQWAAWAAVQSHAIGVHGVERLWHEGNGQTRPGFKALKFLQENGDAMRRLHTWDVPLLGPATRSEDTGAQEDQLFHVGAESLFDPGLGWPRYLAALKLHAERPCNHREADGRPLDPDAHPELKMWNARPLKAISRDMLGKPRQLMDGGVETNNRSGPDTQHWLTQSLAHVCRTIDSPAAQQLMANLATDYLFMRTTQKGWSTTATYSAREWLYEPLFAVHCHRVLEDRALASRVVARCKERIETVLAPEMAGKEVLFTFTDDPRLGAGEWCIAWQECAGAYGLDLFGEVFNVDSARDIALHVARFQFEHGWDGDQGHWLTRAQFPLTGQKPAPDGSFNDFGMPLAPAVVLRREPENPVALAIWNSLKEVGAYRWMPPGVAKS